MKGRNILIIAIALFAVLVGFRIVRLAQSKKTALEESVKFPVEVITVTPTDYDETMSISGTIMAENQTEVPAKVPGKIIRYLFEEGAWVEKAQNVVSIDRDEIGVEFKEALVEAPISGWLTKRYFDTGTHVAPGMPLFQIADYHKVKLVVPVAEADIQRAKLGALARVSFDAWPEQVFTGAVSRVSPTVDYASRTVKAEISIPNSNLKIRPGMYGRATINVKHHTRAIVVLTSAIIERESGKQVFVVVAGKSSVRMVKVDIDMGETSSIKEGLEFGDKLIVAGQNTVADGSPVEITGGK
jgi:multidrug efflux pump subunit AcrA (membrane-fusion protein)